MKNIYLRLVLRAFCIFCKCSKQYWANVNSHIISSKKDKIRSEMRITNPLTLLQRPSSELMPDCHSSAGRRWSRGRDRLYLQVLANCAEAWGSPPKRLVRWRGATEGQRAGRRGPPQPTPMGTGRRSEPEEFQPTGGAASSPSKTLPTRSGWTSTWRGTEWVCQSGGPPGSEKNNYQSLSAKAK